ncbi:hypothetical protein BO79DRAFT_220747 [Aspergillus costaricaensis CBS 115574]|uniref:Uncharacterized protein n=1 Tax=Aspergillus costaricaensis CBS 115574 TaxID=1448317 RepID=A0ACD1I4Y8_9EURO|nr:hypothetical protein BO79DRAFT_220747 [Aspergillus costaricaensis CBS 115574]RAK85568.1 hypothetical protein BO79DRAFT_220747 [Aspergillus costaricaensis CBS 115574]
MAMVQPRDVFWIASCTKHITAICCMQPVERGHISLDDAEGVNRLCPELKDVRILSVGELLEKKSGITLRILLTHTVAGVCEGKDADSDSAAGFGYLFSNHALRDYGRQAGHDEVSGCFMDFMQPLINMDWAGIVLEWLAGQRLDD